MTESDMDQLVRYHNRCRDTVRLARELNKSEVADWIEIRINEGEAHQAAMNKVNNFISDKYTFI